MAQSKYGICDMIKHYATKTPTTEAYIFVSPDGEREPITWKNLYLSSCRTAAGFVNMGVKKGESVYIDTRNCSEGLFAITGAMMAGAHPYTKLRDYRFKQKFDLKSFITKLRECTLLVIDPELCTGTLEDIKQYNTCFTDDGLVTKSELPYVRYIVCVDIGRNKDTERLRSIHQLIRMNQHVDNFPLPPLTEIIMSTSGTTRAPKLMRGIGRHISDFNKENQILRKTKWFLYMEFQGAYCGTTRTILEGVTVVMLKAWLCDAKNYVKIVKDTIVRENCQILTAYVHPLQEIVNSQKNGLPDNWPVKAFFTSGQPLPRSIIQGIGRMGKYVKFNYGSTESSLISSYVVTDFSKFEEYYTGTIQPGVEVKIVNYDGEELPEGTRGEILVKSPKMFTHYIDDSKATEEAFTRDGWFRPNDIGMVKGERKLYVFGRKQHRISINDEVKIDPDIIESKLMSLDGIHWAVVVPVDIGFHYPKICACIIPEHDDLDVDIVKRKYENILMESFDLSERSRYMIDYILFFERFPMTFVHKTDRKLITQMAQDRVINSL